MSPLLVNLTTAEDPPPPGDPPPQEICPTTSQPVLAFEGAMGWAKYAFSDETGGCYDPPCPYWCDVTNGDDYNPATEEPIEGSLRYCVEEFETPRLIRVLYNGEINLKTRLSLDDRSYVKITGEYATDCPNVNECGPTVTGSEFRIKDCNNIIVRYMRFRSGVHAPNHCARSLLISGEGAGCNDIIIDHCSIGASRDDNLAAAGKICRLTVQNCIIGGGVLGLSRAGIGSEPMPGSNSQYDTLTYCRNLITNSYERQLYFCNSGRVDFYNNVVSIARSQLELGAKDGTHGPKINIINNFFRSENNYPWGTYSEDPIKAFVVPNTSSYPTHVLPTSTNGESIYIGGNVYLRYHVKNEVWEEPYTNDQWDFTFDSAVVNPTPPGQPNFPTSLKRTSPWGMPDGDTILDAEGVEDHVLANAGCRLPTSQPALDDYDDDLVTSAPNGVRLYPPPTTDNDGNPGTPELLYPAHQATGVSTTVTLSWTRSDETDDDEVYLGTSTPLTQPVDSTTDNSWQATNLQSNTQYYWRIVARDSCENTSGTGVFSFTTE